MPENNASCNASRSAPVSLNGVWAYAPSTAQAAPWNRPSNVFANSSRVILLTWSSRITLVPGVPAMPGPKLLPTWKKMMFEQDRGQAAERDAGVEDHLDPAPATEDHVVELLVRVTFLTERRQAYLPVPGRLMNATIIARPIVVATMTTLRWSLKSTSPQHLDTDDGDGGEHRQRRATQHRVRDARGDRAGLGDDADDDHDDAGAWRPPSGS